MPKRIGFLYPQLTSWTNLYAAYVKACKHKKSKNETAEWMYHCERNLFELQEELIEQRYQPQPYTYFTIIEPKERVISVASFRDRVLHHALVMVIEPYFENQFIFDSYATRKNKGLHKAVQSAQQYSKQYAWYLKLDVEKYFASVDHEILLSLINRRIKDPQVLNLCQIILKNQTSSMGIEDNMGLPVGNLTSQFFANIYLNFFDQFVKQELKYRGYIRYMDDILLYSDEKAKLQNDMNEIENFLLNHLSLKIKQKSIQLNRTEKGIPFLGYRIFPKLIRVRKENLNRCLRGMKSQENAYRVGKITSELLYQSTQSRLGFLKFANSENLCKSICGENQKAGLTE